MAYLTDATYAARSLLPAAWLTQLAAAHPVTGGDPTYITRQLVVVESTINAQLNKRYAVPFENPPEIVLGWMVALVDWRLLIARGFDGTANDVVEGFSALNTQAREEIALAANARDGLFDLPLAQDSTASGITKGGPAGYREASPFVSLHRQSVAGRCDDYRGTGKTWSRG